MTTAEIINFSKNLNYGLLIKNVSLVTIATVILLMFPNKSNMSIYLMIPLITSLIAKYIFGDIDKGFIWSISDIIYWLVLLASSIATILICEQIAKLLNGYLTKRWINETRIANEH
uniref:Uncharacterized protein n=1 Tax=viral metagenome TaxID=1070528 RepID=A0A6C0E6N0_9ZZZZ